jgi:outer membrane protein OmpA-like peptidoglycan-associated protein
MKRLLNSTTALSLALINVQPWPVMAQTLTEDGYVVAADGSVLCEPSADLACNPDDYVDQAQAIEAAMAEAAAAEAAAAEQAAIEAAAAEAAAAEAAAAEQAAAEAAAAVEAAAAEEAAAAQAAAEEAAAAQAAADEAAAAEAAAAAAAEEEAIAAQAAADQAAAEEAAAAQAAADEAAAAQAVADEAAAAEAAAAQAAQDEAVAAQAAADQAAAEEAAAAAASDDQDAVAKAAADEAEAATAASDAADEAVAAPADPAAEPAPIEVPAVEPVPAEEPAVEPAPAEEPAVEPAPAEVPAVEPAPTEEPAVEPAPAEVPAVEPAPAEEPAVEPAPIEEPVAEPIPTEEPVADPATAEPAATVEVIDPETAARIAEEEAAAFAAAEAELKVQEDGTLIDPAAGLKFAEPEATEEAAAPVEALVPTETEVETLSNLLAEPETIDPAALGAAAALVVAADAAETKPADQEVPAEAVATVTELLTTESARTSSEEFARAPVALADGKKNRLSDLEKVGLVVLGALVVGAIINEGNKKEERRVVSNTGDRVVVLKPDGTYQVYKDDDAVIRRPGSNVRTETYRDGSTRTIVERPDGTQIVTIRDASGRVLRRAQYDELGRELVLINDLEPEEYVVVKDLPKPRTKRVVISTQDDDADLKAALAAKDIAKLGRTFSLRQIREIAEVRALAAMIDVDTITFDSGSAAVKASEAEDLADLGRLMQEMIDNNPGEMFLIEGHTDATGKAAMNLALSDRRAESVALALTEYFDIPPENMVIQGYGESELRIDTLKDEARNRRVAVRIITPLLRKAK